MYMYIYIFIFINGALSSAAQCASSTFLPKMRASANKQKRHSLCLLFRQQAVFVVSKSVYSLFTSESSSFSCTTCFPVSFSPCTPCSVFLSWVANTHFNHWTKRVQGGEDS